MCLIVFAYRNHPRYELVLAANRDEFYQRPTAPMAFWDDAPDLLAGRDRQAGGTWLGISRSGRFAAITNFREPKAFNPKAPSRGTLVSDYLISSASAADYLDYLTPQASRYNGFNLLLRDNEGLFYYSNRGGAAQRLEPGIHGLSNHLLNTPWPKIERGRRALQTCLADGLKPDDLLALLEDRTRPPDSALPDTGVDLARERMLSPLFIESQDYGTRSSTVLLLEQGGDAYVLEKTHARGNAADGLREFSWTVAPRLDAADPGNGI